MGHFLKFHGMPLWVTQGDRVPHAPRAPVSGFPFAGKAELMFLSVAHSPSPPQQPAGALKCHLHCQITQVGRDLRRSLIQPPLKAGSALRSDQVAQGFVKTRLISESTRNGDCTISLYVTSLYPAKTSCVPALTPTEHHRNACLSS